VKGVVIAIRVTETEMTEIACAAERSGRTPAQWAREVLLAALAPASVR
jgi:hypothetical protein